MNRLTFNNSFIISPTENKTCEVHRERLGQQMVSSLLEIAKLTGQPIKQMRVNNNGVFEEIEPKD